VKFHITKNITVLFLILIIPASSAHSRKNTPYHKTQTIPAIKIASFNIQTFGIKKINRPRTLTVLAEIASNFDIIALQEIGSNRSAASEETCNEIMETYIARINEIAGENIYSFIRGDQYAIVYRTDKVKLNDYILYDGEETFSYPPLIANFETVHPDSNLDFSLITIHTSPKLAEEEIPALKAVIEETRDLYCEPDVICLGDFNADGSYFYEGDESHLSEFDPESYITGIPNYYDTTVADSDNTYDRIQMTINMRNDYTGKSGVFRFGEVYDITGCEGGRTKAGTEKAVSDHYPVWCEYFTDRDKD
jgi:endonuclease/exonuclease/phosphatase family metal-dependent hydrolase